MPSAAEPPSPPSCCALGEIPLTAPDAAKLAPMFKAMGDPLRLRMLSMIAARDEVCVCEIAPAFELSSGTISHHLRLLREAGLVTAERRGTFVYYRIVRETLTALGTLLAPAPLQRHAADAPVPHG